MIIPLVPLFKVNELLPPVMLLKEILAPAVVPPLFVVSIVVVALLPPNVKPPFTVNVPPCV